MDVAGGALLAGRAPNSIDNTISLCLLCPLPRQQHFHAAPILSSPAWQDGAYHSSESQGSLQTSSFQASNAVLFLENKRLFGEEASNYAIVGSYSRQLEQRNVDNSLGFTKDNRRVRVLEFEQPVQRRHLLALNCSFSLRTSLNASSIASLAGSRESSTATSSVITPTPPR